jgi:hypothetical protein
MAKYLSDEEIDKAREFDKEVGANIAMLGMFGVCATPERKAALFYHYVEEIESSIEIVINRRNTVVMLTNLEKSLQELLY